MIWFHNKYNCELGWTIKMPFEQGLRETFEYYQLHKDKHWTERKDPLKWLVLAALV